MSGLGMVLGGAFKLGEMATKKVYETAMNEKKKTPPPATTPSTIEEELTKNLQTKEESSNTGPISMEAMRQMNMEARKNANSSISASNDSTTSERDDASIDTKSDNVNSSTTVDISTPVSNKKEKEMKKTVATSKMNIITSNPSASTSSSTKQKKKNKKKNKRRKGVGRGFG